MKLLKNDVSEKQKRIVLKSSRVVPCKTLQGNAGSGAI